MAFDRKYDNRKKAPQSPRREDRPRGDRGDRQPTRGGRPGPRGSRQPFDEVREETPRKGYRDFEYKGRPAPAPELRPEPAPAPRPMEEELRENLLAGRNPIREALKSGRDIEKLLVQKGELSGSAREILFIFLAMALGLATGMGYVALAALVFAVLAVFLLLLQLTGFGSGKAAERDLKITIAEGLQYDGLFDDLFGKYTRSAELARVKTSNMGTLYELEYRIVLKDEHQVQAFLDELRCRNGNLTIVCGRPVAKEAL